MGFISCDDYNIVVRCHDDGMCARVVVEKKDGRREGRGGSSRRPVIVYILLYSRRPERRDAVYHMPIHVLVIYFIDHDDIQGVSPQKKSLQDKHYNIIL